MIELCKKSYAMTLPTPSTSNSIKNMPFQTYSADYKRSRSVAENTRTEVIQTAGKRSPTRFNNCLNKIENTQFCIFHKILFPQIITSNHLNVDIDGKAETNDRTVNQYHYLKTLFAFWSLDIWVYHAHSPIRRLRWCRSFPVQQTRWEWQAVMRFRIHMLRLDDLVSNESSHVHLATSIYEIVKKNAN